MQEGPGADADAAAAAAASSGRAPPLTVAGIWEGRGEVAERCFMQ